MKNIEYQFRFVLFLWIILANLVLQLLHLPFSWAVFVANIMLFTMPGDGRQNFKIVILSGAIGLIFAYVGILAMGLMAPLGSIPSVMAVLCIVLFVIIMLGPVVPQMLNNVTFAYFTCALIAPESFFAGFPLCFLIFVVGATTVNYVSLRLYLRFFEQ